jgi:nucleotide-binding universal stress UspA family protein
MQIFEITQRQPVNEFDYGATKQNVKAAVSPALARGAAIGTGFAGALGNAITNAPLKALGARTGADLIPDADAGKNRESVANRMDAAVQAAMPAITQQADQQYKMWQASVANMVQKAGAQSMDEVDPAQLKNALMAQLKPINQAYGVYNYKNLPREVNPEEHGGRAREVALKTVQSIDAAIAAVLNADPAQQSGAKARDNWLNLTRLLYSAGVQRKFRERDYYSGSSQSLSEPSALSRMIASNPQALAQIQRNAQQAGITPEQLQTLGITPQATVRRTAPAPGPVTAESVNKRSK